MEFLNNTEVAESIINLVIQLFSVSLIGWLIILFIRKKSAIYRSLISSLIMMSMMLLIFISLGFQVMNIAWSGPILSIDSRQAERPILILPAVANTKKTVVIKDSEGENEALNKNIEIPVLVNCFGIIWLGGFLFVLIKLYCSLIFLRGFKAATRTKFDDEFMLILHEVSKVFKFKYVPEVMISKAVESPVVIGVRRVSVLIPESLYGNMTEDEFKSILFHEFAHIHHKDHLFCILDKFIVGLNWWNPFVYFISNEQNLAREDICDNYAIKGIKSAEVYSSCLVNLAEKVCLISNFPATAGMAGRKPRLEERIKSILSKDRKMFSTTKKSAKLTISVICVLVIVFIGGVGISFAKENSLSKVENSGLDTGKKLKNIIFPEIKFKNTDIYTVIRYLNHHSKRNDPDKVGIYLIRQFTPQTANRLPKITMKYSNISMEEILRHLCQKTGLKYRIESGSVLLSYTYTKKEQLSIKSNLSKSDLAADKELILLEVRLYKKARINSPFSDCKLILAPRLVTYSGKKSSIRLVKEAIFKELGELFDSGFVAIVTPSIKGDSIELKGKISISNLSSKSKPNISLRESYLYNTEQQGLLYKLKIKEPEKFYKIGTIKNRGNIYEVRIKAARIDRDGKKISIEIKNDDIRTKLKETKIDYLKFDKMKISKAVRILRKKYGIHIFFRLNPQEWKNEPVVDLEQKNRNLYQVIYFLCKAAKLKFRIEKYAVVISSSFPVTQKENQQIKMKRKMFAIKLSASNKKLNTATEKKLKKIVFSNIDFKNAHIFTVIRVLNRYSKRNDPNKKGIPVIAGFDIKTARALPKITMNFTNISMSELLQHLCKGIGLKYKTEEGAVIILLDSAKKELKLKPEKLAINAAKTWLILVDTEKYSKSWEQASQLFKGAVTEKQWAGAVARARKPLGKNISRKLKSKRYFTSLPGAPDGKYFVVQFKASFKNKKSAIETITTMLDKDGQWRVSGYFIK